MTETRRCPFLIDVNPATKIAFFPLCYGSECMAYRTRKYINAISGTVETIEATWCARCEQVGPVWGEDLEALGVNSDT